MPVRMKYHLSRCAEVVLDAVKPFRTRCLLHRRSHTLQRLKQWSTKTHRHIQERRVMPLGHHKGVPFGRRADVQKSQDMVVLIHLGARNRACYDFTKQTRIIYRPVRTAHPFLLHRNHHIGYKYQ